MDTRWAEELERSFGDGPPPPPPATYVAAGRVAVRRRRLAAGAASLVAVAVVGGLGWASLPGDTRAVSGQVATDPSPTTEPSPTMPPTPDPSTSATSTADSPDDVRVARADELELLEGGPAVTSLADGTLIHLPGWTVERLVVLEDRPHSLAWGIVALDVGGEVQWILHTATPSTGGSTWDAPSTRFARFDDWLAATWASEQGAEEESVARVVDGDVVASDGVTVLEVVKHPDEAAGYGPVGKLAAARLRLADGTEVFGLVAPWGTTTVDPAVLDAPTMAAFLRHLGDQVDSGEGLR